MIRHTLMGLKKMHIFYKRLRSNAHYGNNLVFAQKEKKNSILAKRIRERIQKGCEHKTYTRKKWYNCKE